MRKRILSGSVWLIVLALALSALYSGFVVQYRISREMEDGLRETVQALASAMAYPEDFDETAAQMSENMGGLRVTFVDEEGAVLGDSEVTGRYESNVFERSEFIHAQVGVVGSATRSSPHVGRNMLYVATQTNHGFYIRIGEEYNGFLVDVATLLPTMLLGALLVLLLVAPGIYTYANNLLRPVGEFAASLSGTVEEGGALEPEDYPYEELQSLANSINCLLKKVNSGAGQLEAERKQLDTILNSMNEGLIMLDWDEEVLLINDTAVRILEYVWGSGTNIVHVTRDIALLDAVAEVKKTGAVRTVSIESPSGGRYEAAVSPTGQEGEKGRGIVLILSDMSQYHSTAKVRQEFFQSASHELKTPITSVRGFAELLSTGGPALDEERRRECADRILVETKRMEVLIEEILMIARMESGEIRHENEDLDLAALVREYCDNMQDACEQRGIELKVSIQPCRMYASRKEMLELVNNLMTNALKYNRPDGVIEVRMWVEDGSTLLSVFNTGEAIPESEKERVFERFYRVDKGRSKAVGGTGLGLAIVKHIVGRYGAKVSVMPKPGVGNTFQVAFPPSVGL